MDTNSACHSLWAACSPESPAKSPLLNNVKTDVTILGAGICGLSAALHLAKKGLKVICLEANVVGWGASGRNNGQVVAGLKLDPKEVIKHLGQERGEQLLDCSGVAPDLVFSLIKKYKIECDALRHGWIQPARSKNAIHEITSRMQQWSNLGAAVEMINQNDLAYRLGTNWYSAALFDARGGCLNPLAYTRGLMRAACQEGAQVFEYSPVLSVNKHTQGWSVTTEQGKVLSEQVLICTNAYGQLDDKLTRSIVPVRTAQIATKILDKKDWMRILPNKEAASDASRLLTSFRITADKRLIMGGAYATGGSENAAMFKNLYRAAQNRFPFINDLQIDYKWSGYLAITPSHLPHIFKLDSGCYAAIGCNGRGIAMTTTMGKLLSEVLVSNSADSCHHCPVPITAPTPFTFHGFRNIGIAANVAWLDFLDRINH
ncbi:MAG: FAD-binding oxidoreductase [Alcanivoracaceae bacterium]|nr:FAD-binding oxidoreductase [Alcanivoracaceae bacterium]